MGRKTLGREGGRKGRRKRGREEGVCPAAKLAFTSDFRTADNTWQIKAQNGCFVCEFSS